MALTFELRDEYITLGQLVKAMGLLGTGGEIKTFLTENEILVNGEKEDRRGRKLRAGDVVVVSGEEAIQLQERSR